MNERTNARQQFDEACLTRVLRSIVCATAWHSPRQASPSGLNCLAHIIYYIHADFTIDSP
jgi:hypothetical protein